MPDWIRERFEPLLLGGDRVRDVGNVVKLDADAARAPLMSTGSVSPQPETVTSGGERTAGAGVRDQLSLRSYLPR